VEIRNPVFAQPSKAMGINEGFNRILSKDAFAIKQYNPRLKRAVSLHAGLRGRIEGLDKHDMLQRDQASANRKRSGHGNLLLVV
jgi:hypothetical protein